MSVVACRIYDKKICLASDSQLTNGDVKMPTMEFPKLYTIGDNVVGIVGNCDEVILLLNFIKRKDLPQSKLKLQLYLSKFYKWRNGISEKTETDSKTSPSNIIFIMVSNKKKVFLADGLFVVRVKKYIAIGSGSEIALGALAAGVDVKKAVEITCAYNTLCGLPVVYTEVPI